MHEILGDAQDEWDKTVKPALLLTALTEFQKFWIAASPMFSKKVLSINS